MMSQASLFNSSAVQSPNQRTFQAFCHSPPPASWRRRASPIFRAPGGGAAPRSFWRHRPGHAPARPWAHRHRANAPSGAANRIAQARRHRWGRASALSPNGVAPSITRAAVSAHGQRRLHSAWRDRPAGTGIPAMCRRHGEPACRIALSFSATAVSSAEKSPSIHQSSTAPRIFPTCGPSGTPACDHIAAGEREARLFPAIGDRQQHAPLHGTGAGRGRGPVAAGPGP